MARPPAATTADSPGGVGSKSQVMQAGKLWPRRMSQAGGVTDAGRAVSFLGGVGLLGWNDGLKTYGSRAIYRQTALNVSCSLPVATATVQPSLVS